MKVIKQSKSKKYMNERNPEYPSTNFYNQLIKDDKKGRDHIYAIEHSQSRQSLARPSLATRFSTPKRSIRKEVFTTGMNRKRKSEIPKVSKLTSPIKSSEKITNVDTHKVKEQVGHMNQGLETIPRRTFKPVAVRF